MSPVKKWRQFNLKNKKGSLSEFFSEGKSYGGDVVMGLNRMNKTSKTDCLKPAICETITANLLQWSRYAHHY